MSVDMKGRKGFTRWNLGYKIKDGKRYLDLESIKENTLEEAGFSEEYIQSLIGINDSYEIRIESLSHRTLQELAQIFLEKTDPDSNKWPDLYTVPVIFLLGTESIPYFLPVNMYQQRRVRDSLNFVQRGLNGNIEKILEEDGFERMNCLANSLFVERCCNQ